MRFLRRRAAVEHPDELMAEGIRVHFGGVKAVDGVDLRLERGQIVGLIGPNGAGKTTLVNAITGFVDLTTGRVQVGPTDVTGLRPDQLAGLGISRTFQSGRLFGAFTVRENLEVPAVASGLSRKHATARASEVLELIGAADYADVRADALPLGTERRLEVARAFAAEPKFTFLDEPAAGLSEAEGKHLGDRVIEWARERDCGVLIIEHDMDVIMRVCDRIQVLSEGLTISVGTPDEVRSDARVIDAYLGTPTA